MNVLQILASPRPESFTSALATAFKEGAISAGNQVCTYNVFDNRDSDDQIKEAICKADHICFAWPCMWEMPPAKLVDFLQTTFVKGFAFDEVDGTMVPRLKTPVTCLVSMGQRKKLNTTNLVEAFRYCGMYPQFLVFENVGPRMTQLEASRNLDFAKNRGSRITMLNGKGSYDYT